MPTAPAAPKPSAAPRLRTARYLSGIALIALASAAVAFADVAPWLGALSTIVGVAAGKMYGVGTIETLKLGLQLLSPDKAAEVVTSAIKSLPPAQAEAAAETILASLPPAAVQRFSFAPPAPTGPLAPNGQPVRFIGTSEPPAAQAQDEEVTTPHRPSRPPRGVR